MRTLSLCVSLVVITVILCDRCVCVQGLSFQDDEADEQLNKEYTEQFNFGGGLFERKADSTSPDADPDMRRSKKEVPPICPFSAAGFCCVLQYTVVAAACLTVIWHYTMLHLLNTEKQQQL